MVGKKPKTIKGKEEKDDVAAMYSMPDKSKKNPEVSLFDIKILFLVCIIIVVLLYIADVCRCTSE